MRTVTLCALFFWGGLCAALAEETKSPQAEAQESGVVAVTAEKAKALLSKKDRPIVIDLRTEDEYKEGHLEGARQIDFRSDTFREELSKLDKGKAYLFHCKSGGRSTQSLAIWKELGFTKLYHLDSGILGWKEAGGKVVRK